jgi:hypothetical protein
MWREATARLVSSSNWPISDKRLRAGLYNIERKLLVDVLVG